MGLCFRKLHGFWLPGSNTIGKSLLSHPPGPSTRIIVVHTWGLSEKLKSSWDGVLQLLGLKSLPDVWNRIKIPGMPSLLAPSITVAQTVPPRASPKPQPCQPAFDASILADRASPAETLAGRRQDS